MLLMVLLFFSSLMTSLWCVLGHFTLAVPHSTQKRTVRENRIESVNGIGELFCQPDNNLHLISILFGGGVAWTMVGGVVMHYCFLLSVKLHPCGMMWTT